MQRKFELAVKKNEVHLVELESGKGSSVRVGAENTPVYGDLGVRAHLDHVPLAELGHHHPCGRVVLIVFLTVRDYIACKIGGVVIIKYSSFLCKCQSIK